MAAKTAREKKGSTTIQHDSATSLLRKDFNQKAIRYKAGRAKVMGLRVEDRAGPFFAAS